MELVEILTVDGGAFYPLLFVLIHLLAIGLLFTSCPLVHFNFANQAIGVFNFNSKIFVLRSFVIKASSLSMHQAEFIISRVLGHILFYFIPCFNNYLVEFNNFAFVLPY